MEDIINKIKELSLISKYIRLYTNFDVKVTMKNVGKISGETDKQYIDFLKLSNGASILDYCILGIKNSQLGINVYEQIVNLWQMDKMLTFRFWGIITTSTSENFGYIDLKNKSGNHFIGYYNTEEPETVYLVASSFKCFLTKFLKEIEFTLLHEGKAIYLISDYWLTNNPDEIKLYDEELANYINEHNGEIKYNLYKL